MLSIKDAIIQYQMDLDNTSPASALEAQKRGMRIRENFKNIINYIGVLAEGSGNIDGGSADTIYLPSQRIDGGCMDCTEI